MRRCVVAFLAGAFAAVAVWFAVSAPKRSITLSDGRVLTYRGATTGTNTLVVGSWGQKTWWTVTRSGKPLSVFGKTLISAPLLLSSDGSRPDWVIFWLGITPTGKAAGGQRGDYLTFNDLWIKAVDQDGETLKPCGGSGGGGGFGHAFSPPNQRVPYFKVLVFQKADAELKPVGQFIANNPLLHATNK